MSTAYGAPQRGAFACEIRHDLREQEEGLFYSSSSIHRVHRDCLRLGFQLFCRWRRTFILQCQSERNYANFVVSAARCLALRIF